MSAVTAPQIMPTRERAIWLTPGVRGIGAASLLADIGHEIPTALLPSLLTSTLGAPASALGAIEGVSDALAGLARFGGGALSDEPERRRSLAVGGYTATAVLSAAIAPVTATWQVAVLRAGAWTARGLRVPARNALLADVVPAAAYGRAYGFERAMDNIGAILGPIAAIGLVATVGIRWAIGLSVIPGLLAALAIVYAIRHTPRPTPQPKRQLKFHIRPVLTGKLRALFAGIGAFELGNCAATLLILRATELLQPEHGKDRATTIALTLYVTYNIAATITSLIAGRFSDRNGPTRVLLAGIVAFGIAYLGFTHDTPNWVVLLPWFHTGRHRYRLRRDRRACRGRDARTHRYPRIRIWSTSRDAEFRQPRRKPGRRDLVDHPEPDMGIRLPRRGDDRCSDHADHLEPSSLNRTTIVERRPAQQQSSQVSPRQDSRPLD